MIAHRASPAGQVGAKRHATEIVRRQVTVPKALDRRAEKTLDFSIQVEKTDIQKAGQLCAKSGLADTTYASKEYPHLATFD